MKIKLSNITNLSDARFAAAAGIDYIGFCFDKTNSNYIQPFKAKEIIDWTSGIKVVGEFTNQNLEEINTICKLLQVDLLEIENDFTVDELAQFEIPIIKKINISSLDEVAFINEIELYKNSVYAFQLYSNQTSENISEIYFGLENKMIWGNDVNANNIKNIVDEYRPYAINISSDVEEKIGLKNFDELNELLEIVSSQN